LCDLVFGSLSIIIPFRVSMSTVPMPGTLGRM
jgi:hypothetical protein